MRGRVIIGALLLVSIGVFLGATVLRDEVAQATRLAQSVTVANTPDSPVPVTEQNQDSSGNVKVHEQGTADVNVTNSALPVAPALPITGGGDGLLCYAQTLGHSCSFGDTRTASALSIHMTGGVVSTQLYSSEGTVGSFDGPLSGGNASIVLALARPIELDGVRCTGLGVNEFCSVGLIGNSP
jgi:hypothetical protein